MNKESTTKYLDKKFFKKVLFLALPVSIQYLLHSSRYIADVLMLGQVGENELASAGMVTGIHMVANSAVFGLSGAIGLLCAQYFGAKDQKGVSSSLITGLFSATLLMLPVVILFFSFPQYIVRVATNDTKLLELGALYLRITAPLPILVGIVAGTGAALNALGKPHINLIFTTLAVILNIFLNWVFIFGNLGAPQMGLKGAALATLLSITLETIIIFVYLGCLSRDFCFKKITLKNALAIKSLKTFSNISLPLIAGGTIWHAGAFIYQAIYGHMGATELAVITMVHPLRTICFSFFWGISSATGVIMGHHLGAKEFHQAYVKSWVLIFMGMIVSIMAAVLLWTYETQIFALFGNIAPQTLAQAQRVLKFMLATIWILAINVIGIVGVLQSGADNRFILKMDIFCQWAMGIPLCYLAAFVWKLPLEIVFLAAFSEEIIKLALWIPRVYSKAWVRNIVS